MLTNRALSKTPAMMPAMNEAQLNPSISCGTDTNVFVIGATSPIMSAYKVDYVNGFPNDCIHRSYIRFHFQSSAPENLPPCRTAASRSRSSHTARTQPLHTTNHNSITAGTCNMLTNLVSLLVARSRQPVSSTIRCPTPYPTSSSLKTTTALSWHTTRDCDTVSYFLAKSIAVSILFCWYWTISKKSRAKALSET